MLGAYPWQLDIVPGGLEVGAATLADIVEFAYQIKNPGEQLKGLTGWMATERWAIDARTPPGAPNLREDSALARQMVQHLLATRFDLEIHPEVQVLPVYELRVNGQRPKSLLPSHDPSLPHMLYCCYKDGKTSQPQMWAEAMTMADLAGASSEDRVVIDKTGLTGTYQFKVSVTPGRVPWGEMNRALIGALGLKLVGAKAPLTVNTVTRASLPRPN